MSNNIHPAPPTDRVVILENFSSAGIKAGDASTDAIFFGRITRAKGVDRMLAFWSRHQPGGTLHVIGDGDLLAEMKQRHAHVGSYIVFHGALPHAEISRIASECRYYVSFSDREGLSLSLLEAMDGGLIPLVTDLPSQQFVFEIPGIPVVVGKGGDDTLAVEIARINALPPEARADLRAKIQHMVRTRFRDRWMRFWDALIA